MAEVKLIHATPDGDQLIGFLARVSNDKAQPTDPSSKLIRYLILHNHWSPFQMASACIEINTTRDIGRQILRHQSAIGFQEFSGRYAAYDRLEEDRECRFQDVRNRQNSLDATEGQSKIVDAWKRMVALVSMKGMLNYNWALEKGIAKEQARAILPEGLVPTKMYFHGSIRTWLHYLNERMKPGVQKEHREIAHMCYDILEPIFPDTFKAFLDIYTPITPGDIAGILKDAAIGEVQADKAAAMVHDYLVKNGKLRS